jgi:hypothetical protein
LIESNYADYLINDNLFQSKIVILFNDTYYGVVWHYVFDITTFIPHGLLLECNNNINSNKYYISLSKLNIDGIIDIDTYNIIDKDIDKQNYSFRTFDFYELKFDKQIQLYQLKDIYKTYTTDNNNKLHNNIYNLDKDEETLNTIKKYTLGLYRDINSSLLNNKNMNEINNHIKILDTAFEKYAQKNKNIMFLFRGVNAQDVNKPYTGKMLSFLSTSTNMSISRAMFTNPYTNCCVYNYIVLPDIPYLSLKKYSNSEREDEILLPRNLYATIINTYTVNKMTYYDTIISLTEDDPLINDIFECKNYNLLKIENKQKINNTSDLPLVSQLDNKINIEEPPKPINNNTSINSNLSAIIPKKKSVLDLRPWKWFNKPNNPV